MRQLDRLRNSRELLGDVVGSFVRVHTETACGNLSGEVIYKEGAHPSLEADAWLDPALSGAPATVSETVNDQPVSIVRERLVLDFAAFGEDGSDVTPRRYDRLCRRELWLDAHGHLLMEAMYSPAEAELEDLDFYADYLLKEHREGLLAFCFQEELPEDELREALLRSFDAVRELALESRELRCWRGKYFFSIADYEARLNDPERALGAGDLRAIFRSLAHVPASEDRCCSPIRSRILEVLERDGLDDQEESLVRGCQYATAVCHANAFAGETLANEQKSGILPEGVHLRLDDDWEGGGIWRAERVEHPSHYSLKSVPALIPVKLGYTESLGVVEASETFASVEQPIASSQTGFRIPLTRRDRELGRLRLTPEAAEALAPGAVDVYVRHDDARERWGVEREDGTLYGIQYPLELHSGILLHCNVERGGSVVRIRTVRVTPALIASDGRSFDFDTSLAVYEREMGLKGLKSTEKHGSASLTELVNRAFRTCGRKREDGSRVLTMSELATAILGPVWRTTELRPLQEAVAAMGLDRVGGEFTWRPRFTRSAPAFRSSKSVRKVCGRLLTLLVQLTRRATCSTPTDGRPRTNCGQLASGGSIMSGEAEPREGPGLTVRARGMSRSLLLAGDVGATATDLGIFSRESGLHRPLATATFASGAYRTLEDVVRVFLEQAGLSVEHACIGVAGPVIGGNANITNLPWSLDEAHLADALELRSACLINDLVATAEAVPLLKTEDTSLLSRGKAVLHGPLAVVAPGTGLGEAFLTWERGGYRVHASEGGHADFAPATTRQSELLRYLWASFSHVSYERVCSGLGLLNLRAFLKTTGSTVEDAAHELALAEASDPTRAIVQAALAGGDRCPLCVETVDLFAEILAAEAANLALKVMATGGVYLAGGLPARMLPVLQEPRFMATFCDKGRSSRMVSSMPVSVVLNPKAALVGVAHHGLARVEREEGD